MNIGFSFTPDKTTVQNLKSISAELSSAQEQRICELHELADDFASSLLSMIGEEFGVSEALALLADSLEVNFFNVHCGMLEINKARIAKCLDAVSEMDKAFFAQLLCESIRAGGLNITESDFLPANQSDSQSFVYVKNTLADEAYDVFSQEFADPRVRYAQSFKEAIRCLTDGSVAYCLLPLEERGGSRIRSISELIMSEDLKIDSVTPVFGFDGNADMKYALVSKYFMPTVRGNDDDRYLELRISSDKAADPSALVFVAGLLGYSLYRINTERYTSYGENKDYCSVVLRDEGQDFLPLLIYLTLFGSDYIPVGLYKNLE